MTTWAQERTGSLRVGDAERDRAASALAEHFAAGRLAKEEYEERVAGALGAVHQHDLAPLFADLPGFTGLPGVEPKMLAVAGSAAGPARVGAGAPWPILFVPLLALVLVAVVASSPWVLFLGIWVVCLGGARLSGCRSGRRGRPGNGRGGPWQR